jgi:hypothetical protein
MKKDKITPEEFIELETKIREMFNNGDPCRGPFQIQDSTEVGFYIQFPLELSSSGCEIIDYCKKYIYSKPCNIFAKNLNRQPNNSYTII